MIGPGAYCYARLDGDFLKCLVDTGSMITFVLRSAVPQSAKLKKANREAYTANGSKFRFDSKFEGVVTLGPARIKMTVFVADLQNYHCELLLGADCLTKLPRGRKVAFDFHTKNLLIGDYAIGLISS
ncbi:hypothetical protein L596_012536 [Steinernema carpocapsae]|uniref:Retropepsins domain-containing protein n=1 Tax=Steinernema carpocapsae TaxID=34508 RepID=A0A4U5NXC3_STECR|nr:hypothetical protein L596_012536 [Steinernema carpocapsae]